MTTTLNLTTNQFLDLEWYQIYEHFEFAGLVKLEPTDDLEHWKSPETPKSITYRFPKSINAKTHIDELWYWVNPKNNDPLIDKYYKDKYTFDYIENDKNGKSTLTITWR